MEYLVWYLHDHVYCFEMLWGPRLSQVCIKISPFHALSPQLAQSSYISGQSIDIPIIYHPVSPSGQSIQSPFGGKYVVSQWQQSGCRVAASLNLPGAQACWSDDCPGTGLDWLGRCHKCFSYSDVILGELPEPKGPLFWWEKTLFYPFFGWYLEGFTTKKRANRFQVNISI